jgi:hypothetical protein
MLKAVMSLMWICFQDVDLRLKKLPEEESTMLDEHHSFTDEHVGHISDVKK